MTIKPILFGVLATSLMLGACQPIHSISQEVKPSKIGGLAHTQTSYADKRTLTIADTDYPVSETSARLLVNQGATAPKLVDDIYDGKGDKAVAGYKLMVINRTSSLLAEARPTPNGVIDNRMLHRGAKALIGIPVVAGQAHLDKAVLLDFDIIYDDPNAPLADGKIVKERGQKLTKPNVAIDNRKVIIRSLTLPNIGSGERSGGGIDFEASATIDGKTVSTSANSAFMIFYVATPDKARGFNAF